MSKLDKPDDSPRLPTQEELEKRNPQPGDLIKYHLREKYDGNEVIKSLRGVCNIDQVDSDGTIIFDMFKTPADNLIASYSDAFLTRDGDFAGVWEVIDIRKLQVISQS